MPIEYTCVSVTASSTTCTVSASSTEPLLVRDSGELVFGIGILIFFSSIMFFGLVGNSLKSK